jgi:hypothetical protein
VGFFLAAVHAFFSLSLLTPAYYGKYFDAAGAHHAADDAKGAKQASPAHSEGWTRRLQRSSVV